MTTAASTKDSMASSSSIAVKTNILDSPEHQRIISKGLPEFAEKGMFINDACIEFGILMHIINRN